MANLTNHVVQEYGITMIHVHSSVEHGIRPLAFVHDTQFIGLRRTRIAKRDNVLFESHKDRLPLLEIYARERIYTRVSLSFRHVPRVRYRGDAIPDVGRR